MTSRSTRWAAMLLALAYVGIASIALARPGLNYDEMLFVNAALGGPDPYNSFIFSAFHGIPLMLMSYIGALKAWLFAPIFLVFGVSVVSVRLPVILLTGAAVFVLYRATLRGTRNASVAIGVLIALAFSPVFMAFTRIDLGPVVLEMLFKALLIASFFSFLDTGRARFAGAMILVAVLGVYNKLNFLWMVNGLVLAMLVYRRQLRVRLAPIGRTAPARAAWLSCAMTPYALFALLYYGGGNEVVFRPTAHGLVSTAGRKLHAMASLASGSLFHDYVGIRGSVPGGFALACVALLATAVGTVQAARRRDDRLSLFFRFNLVLLAAHIVQILLTPGATEPWHQITLYPFITTTTVIGLYWMARELPARERIRDGTFSTLLAASASWGLFIYGQDLGGLSRPVGNFAMSTAIFDLARVTRALPYKFVSTDWGTHTQLLGLYGKGGKYVDLWPSFKDGFSSPTAQRYFCDAFMNPRNTYAFITKSDQALKFPATKAHLFALADDCHVRLTSLGDIPGNGLSNEYELYVPRSP